MYMVSTFKSPNEILVYDHSNQSYLAVLFCDVKVVIKFESMDMMK